MEKALVNRVVTLQSHRGAIRRVVVEDFGHVITVTTPQELEAAQRDGRRPSVAGFPKSDLLEISGS